MGLVALSALWIAAGLWLATTALLAAFRLIDIPSAWVTDAEAAFGFVGLLLASRIIFAVLLVLAGVGCLLKKPWGRTTGLLLSVLQLLTLPVGTVLGIVGLYVLARARDLFPARAVSEHVEGR